MVRETRVEAAVGEAIGRGIYRCGLRGRAAGTGELQHARALDGRGQRGVERCQNVV